jgi:hypothetical protein
VTREFFDWYLSAINGTTKTDYQPKFIKSKNGMTTLDFEGYFDNLKRLRFADNLILKERESYNECLTNLSKIKFTDFETRFTDLDQFENRNCDFENYYRWTGGQELIEGIKIEKVDQIKADKILVTVIYYVDNGKGYGLTYWGNNKLSLSKINDTWNITDINWRD